MPNQHQGIAP